jgi:signal transduction histidine kinase
MADRSTLTAWAVARFVVVYLVGSSLLLVLGVDTLWMAVLLAGAVGAITVWWSLRGAVRVLDAAASGRPSRRLPGDLDRIARGIEDRIGELERRSQEAEQSLVLLEEVLARFPHGVVVVDGDEQVIYMNPVAVTLAGGESAHLSGLTPHRLQTLIRQVLSEGVPRSQDVEQVSPQAVLSVSAIPAGRHVVAVVTDVTEQRRVEQMRRDFVADASHELKTPLASITASLEALRIALHRRPDRVEEFVSRVEAGVGQLARIVEDLLDLSRLESSHLEMTRVDLARLAGEEAARFASKAEAAGIELVVELNPAEVDGSPRDLALAIRNLCDNAIRYTDAGGKVVLRVFPDADRAVVEVADNGIGIPRRALSRVFERFYRVDSARSRATGGTGLGLAIVKHVVQRHGGTVTVESELGAGSTFRVSLPRNQTPSGN